MKRMSASVTCFIFSSLMMFMLSSEANASEDDVMGVVRQWEESLTEGDIDSIMELISDEYLGPQGEGKADLRQAVLGLMGQGFFDEVEIDAGGAEALVDGDRATVFPIRFETATGALPGFLLRLELADKADNWRITSMESEPLPEPERVSKALVIGVDGVRPDALIAADTPNINKLIANGTFDPRCLILGERYRENNTVSGPGWSSILTGVWADKHGVNDNTFQGRNYEEYPHFFERIKAARPDALAVSLVSVWRPIDRFIVSGADIRHFFQLAGGTRLDVNVSADDVGIDTRDGQWHHLLGMRRGRTVTLYLNGIQVASVEDSAEKFDLRGEVYHIGRDARSGETELDGELRNVRIWNRALSQREIEALVEDGDFMALPDPVLEVDGPLSRRKEPLEGDIKKVTLADFALGAWFRTTDTGRNIIMGNYGDASDGHLNLELHTDNRVRLFINPVPGHRMEREKQTDTMVTDKAVGLLKDTDPTAVWIYLHQPDAAGHWFGFSAQSSEYMEAIENVDHHVGRIMDAVRSRPSHDLEDWVVVMTTDHGGYGRRHGGGHAIPEILHGFMLVSGDVVHNRISPRQSYIVDAVPTVLKHLGMDIDPDLDGYPLGLE